MMMRKRKKHAKYVQIKRRLNNFYTRRNILKSSHLMSSIGQNLSHSTFEAASGSATFQRRRPDLEMQTSRPSRLPFASSASIPRLINLLLVIMSIASSQCNLSSANHFDLQFSERANVTNNNIDILMRQMPKRSPESKTVPETLIGPIQNVDQHLNDKNAIANVNISSTTKPKIGTAELNPDASDVVPLYMQHMTVILVILHLSVFITGLVGNSLVCLSVYRNQSLQTVTNYYIVNLAVADFLVILICLPPTVYWDLNLTWNFGLIPCKLVLYLQSISVSVSVLTLTCISIDRWYAICRPLEFSSTKSRAKNIIALIWLVSMIIASPDVIFLTTKPLYEEDGYVYMDCTYSWPEDNTKIYQLCIVTLLFVLPFVLMIISYSHIVNVLWRNEMMTESMQNSSPLEEEQLQKRNALLLAAERDRTNTLDAQSICHNHDRHQQDNHQHDNQTQTDEQDRPQFDTSLSPSDENCATDNTKQATISDQNVPVCGAEPNDKSHASCIDIYQGSEGDKTISNASAHIASGCQAVNIANEIGLEHIDASNRTEHKQIIAPSSIDPFKRSSKLFANGQNGIVAVGSLLGKLTESLDGGERNNISSYLVNFNAYDDHDHHSDGADNGIGGDGTCIVVTGPSSKALVCAKINEPRAINSFVNSPKTSTGLVGSRRYNLMGRRCAVRAKPKADGSCILEEGSLETLQLGSNNQLQDLDNDWSTRNGRSDLLAKSCSIETQATTLHYNMTTHWNSNWTSKLSSTRLNCSRSSLGNPDCSGRKLRLHQFEFDPIVQQNNDNNNDVRICSMGVRSNVKLDMKQTRATESKTPGESENFDQVASGKQHASSVIKRVVSNPEVDSQPSEDRQVKITTSNEGSYTTNSTRLTSDSRVNASKTAKTSLNPSITSNAHRSIASCSSSNARFYKLIESRKKAAKMLIVIVIMFGLCYVPVHFLNTLRYTVGLPQNDITTIASLVSHWLCYFNSAINPLIYNLMSGKFRHEFANLFFCRCFRRHQAGNQMINIGTNNGRT